MPRSLFLKIFLWFGAVLVTVIVGTFIISEVKRREPEPMRRPLDQILDTYAREASREYESGGQPALIAYLDAKERESRIRAFLFNSQLLELSGRQSLSFNNRDRQECLSYRAIVAQTDTRDL